MAHRDCNQSGAEKDNRLLFREQWMLLFSKAKIASTFSTNQIANTTYFELREPVRGHVRKRAVTTENALPQVILDGFLKFKVP